MRRRITVMAFNAAVLAVALFGGALAVVAWRYAFTDERGELERAADRAAVVAALDHAQPGDPLELPGRRDDVSVVIYGRDGRRIAGVGPARADAVARAALRGKIDDNMRASRLRVAVPVASGERVVGAVEASSPRSTLLARIAVAWLGLLGLAVLALAPPAIAARRQARRLAEPLERLADEARRLGDGRFQVSIPPSGIAEIDTASHTLADTADRLGALVEHERAFAREASHQLRTPLTGLRLLLETGLDSDAAALHHSAVQAVGMVDKLEDRITDLLRVRGEPPADQAVAVAEIIDDVERTYRGMLAAEGRSLRVDSDDDVPDAAGSTAAVRQAVGSLVDNAVRHGSGEVRVRARNASGALALDVVDEGQGVTDAPDEDVSSWPAGRHEAGHGLGLELARALVATLDGRILHNRESGSRFTILLPARRPPQDSVTSGADDTSVDGDGATRDVLPRTWQ